MVAAQLKINCARLNLLAIFSVENVSLKIDSKNVISDVKLHLGFCELGWLHIISVMGAILHLCASILAPFLCIKGALRMRLNATAEWLIHIQTG